MTRVAVDTSVSIAYLLTSHTAHLAVSEYLDEVTPVLTTHSLVETYSVLTRLPGDARLRPLDAVRLIDENFGEPVTIGTTDENAIHRILAEANVAGGATYDALVGLAAQRNQLSLATRDARARSTYAALGVRVETITG